jgi:hypothetical protein
VKRLADEYFNAKQEVGGISDQIYEIADLINMVMFGDYYLEMFALCGSDEFQILLHIDPVLVGRDWPGINVTEGHGSIEYPQYPRT